MRSHNAAGWAWPSRGAHCPHPGRCPARAKRTRPRYACARAATQPVHPAATHSSPSTSSVGWGGAAIG